MTAVWSPHAGSQVQFLACPVFECLLEGTRGGGKTAALLMSFAQYVGVGFGQAWRGVLFRETYPQLADVAGKLDTTVVTGCGSTYTVLVTLGVEP